LHLISNHIHTIVNTQATTKYKTIHKILEALTTQQSNSPTTNVEFLPRVVNNTNIVLSNDELSLLNKGLRYNLRYKRRNWLHTLAFEADAAITYLPTSEQEGMHYLVAQQIQLLYRRQTREPTRNTLHAKHEKHILNSIRSKLKNNKAIITKVDKGSSIVIIYAHDHHTKIMQFISDNKYDTLPHDPTNKFQRTLRATVNNSETLIP
jgi:pyruvate carboxylase